MNNVQLMTINNTFYLTELKSYGIKILENVIFLNIFSHSTYLKSRCTCILNIYKIKLKIMIEKIFHSKFYVFKKVNVNISDKKSFSLPKGVLFVSFVELL